MPSGKKSAGWPKRAGSISSSARAAVRLTDVQRSSDRWDSASNGRIDSTSSPKNSIRTGSDESVGNTSRMPPRTLNSPGTSTTSTRVMPRSSSQRVNSSTGTVSPTETIRDIASRASGFGTGWSIA